MAYCTLQNIIDVVSEAVAIQLTDDDNQGLVQQEKIDKAIFFADQMIDSYLRGRYQVPFQSVPGLITNLSTDLAIYFLYDRRLGVDMPASVESKYKKAVDSLEKLQKGSMVLESENAGEKPSEYRTNKNADDREFNREVWEKY